jgi:transposase InsO family protein
VTSGHNSRSELSRTWRAARFPETQVWGTRPQCTTPRRSCELGVTPGTLAQWRDEALAAEDAEDELGLAAARLAPLVGACAFCGRARFATDGSNRKWLCDIAYISTDEGFLYLAGVMDACSRSIVGWSMSDSLHATVALDTLRMAVARRNPPSGLVHHSDRGVQYACRECRDLLEEHGMAQSMSRSGNCYDNAMMESLWATLKKELVHGRRFRTHDEARLAIFEWIEVWYQRTRICGALGYLSPEVFEAAARAE